MNITWQKHITEGSQFLLGGFGLGYNFVIIFPSEEYSAAEELIASCDSATVVRQHRSTATPDSWHTWIVAITDLDDALTFKLMVS
jgi:hypothetical protein